MSVCIRNVSIAALAAFLVVSSGCKKKPTIEDTKQPVPQADTKFTEPEPFKDADTSDDASFRQADLDAELDRQVRQNLLPVYFEFNSYNLSPEGADRLRTAANFLMEHKSMRVLIEGHCDERGTSEYNMGLGENRARAVKQYLANYGLPSLQMETTSWGKERLAATGCSDDQCHQQNRRTEFKVLAR